MLKNSKQREAVLEYLKGRTDHPTAEQIYDAVKKDFPRISLGTVYRNLSVLSEQHLIQKIVCENGDSYRFDYNMMPHSHFSCTKCGKILDFQAFDRSTEVQELEEKLHVRVSDEKTVYYGLCAECAAEEK